MQVFKKKKGVCNPNIILLHCLFYLKAIFTNFLVFLALSVPLIVRSVEGSL